MESWQINHIKKNLPSLMDQTRCDEEFLSYFQAEGKIAGGDVSMLEAIGNQKTRSFKFYELIKTRTNSYQVLIDVLRETAQSGAADLLEKGYAVAGVSPPASKKSEQDDEVAGPVVNTPVPATPPPAPVQIVKPLVVMGTPATDSAGSAPPTPKGDQVDFMNNVQPLEISLTRPQKRMAFPDDEYELREDFKGYALVLNIVDFVDTRMSRAGGKNDTMYMTQLWTALGYRVTTHEGGFAKHEVMSILETFASQFTQDPSAASCVVFIGSHGHFSKIECSDHQPIDLYRDLIYKFDSSQCPQLQGKPKIFIVQACQRFQTDSVPDRTQVDAMLQTPIDDTIVCFSTIPGYVANRDLYLGTWYVYCFAKVFMEEAHQTHLLGLLKRVQETMRNINAQAPQGQLSAYMDLGIKNLYFNMYKQP